MDGHTEELLGGKVVEREDGWTGGWLHWSETQGIVGRKKYCRMDGSIEEKHRWRNRQKHRRKETVW